MLKKLMAAYTVLCFVVSFIAAPAAEGAQERARQSRSAAQLQAALDARGACSLVIPTILGRITGSFSSVPLPGSPSTLELPDAVIIQDLHCHPEAQRKIAGIIDAVCDAAGGVSGVRVFVEGASGPVDTSWVMAIDDPALRERVRDALIESGRLTGAEFWAMRQPSDRAGRAAADDGAPAPLLYGLEDRALHRDNIVRLADIMAHGQKNERILEGMARDVAYLRNAYLSPRNRRFHRILERYAAGDMSSVRYFTLLREYVRNINEHPERYGSVLPVRWRAYPTLETFLQAHAMEKRLNHKRAAAQMGVLIGVLKETLPYGVYDDLRRRSSNFGRLDVLVPAVGNLFEHYQLDKAGDFSELKLLFTCRAMQESINPLQLLREERHLVESLRIALADDVAEVEVAFLADFFTCFARYIRHAQTPDEYEYFRARFEKFRSLWGTYFIHNDILDFADELGALDAYFAVNERRTAVFLESMTAAERPDAGRGRIVNVVVTGGFHAEGLARGLEERQSSYIVITPNITTDTTAAGRVYGEIIGEQARLFASQALAALPPSASAQVVSVQDDRVAISIGGYPFVFTLKDGILHEQREDGPAAAADDPAAVMDRNTAAAMATAVRRTVNLFAPNRLLNPQISVVTVVVALSRIAIMHGATEGWWEPGGLIWEIFKESKVVQAVDQFAAGTARDTDQIQRLEEIQRLPEWWQENIKTQSDVTDKATPFVTALDEALNGNLHLFVPAQRPSLTFTATRIWLNNIFTARWTARHSGLVEFVIAPLVESPVFLKLTFFKWTRMTARYDRIKNELHAANTDPKRELIDRAVEGVVRWVTVGVVAAVAAVLISAFLPQGVLMAGVVWGSVAIESANALSHAFYQAAFRHEGLTSWLIGRMFRASDRQRSHEIRELAGALVALPAGRQIVFLNGPSASGKTTTTKEIIAAAETHGRRVVRLSLDEYYRLRSGPEREKYDRMRDAQGSILRDADGNELLNYDTPNALNWDLVAADITALMLGHTVKVKRYVRTRKGNERETESEVQLGDNDIVVVEGIFALTAAIDEALRQNKETMKQNILAYADQFEPAFLTRVNDDTDTWYDEAQNIFLQSLSAPGDPNYNPAHNHTIFIEPTTPFDGLGATTSLGNSDDVLRLLRRLNRDSNDTNTPANMADIIKRYPSVLEGAATYINPSRERARWVLNTYRAGEVYFWAALLRAELTDARAQAERDGDTNAAAEINALLQKMERLPGVLPGTMRAWYARLSRSVLREFAGETPPAPRPVGYLVSAGEETNAQAVPAGYAAVRIRPMPEEGTTRYKVLKQRRLKNLAIAGNKVWLDETDAVPTLYVLPGDSTFDEMVPYIIAAIHGTGVLQGKKRPLRILRSIFEKRGMALDAAKALVFWDGHPENVQLLGNTPVFPFAAGSFSAQALLNAHTAETAARRHESGFLVKDLGVFLDGSRANSRYDNQLFFVTLETLGQTDTERQTQMQEQVRALKQRGANVVLLCETSSEATQSADVLRKYGIDHVVVRVNDTSPETVIPPDIVVDNNAFGAEGVWRDFVVIDENSIDRAYSAPIIAHVTLPAEEKAREKMIERLNALPVGTTLIFDASGLQGISDGGMDIAQYGVNLFASFFGTVNQENQELYQRKVARRLAPLSFREGLSDDELNNELEQLLDMIRNADATLDRSHPNAAYAEAARVHLTQTNDSAQKAFIPAAEQYLRMRYFLARQGKPLGMADRDVEELMETCFNVTGDDVAALNSTINPNTVIDTFRNTHKNEQNDGYARAFKREIMEQARELITPHNEQRDAQALRNALELLALLDGKIVLPTIQPGDVNLQAIYTILSAA